MSSEAVGWVFRHSTMTGTALTVHLAVADSVNDQNGNEFWLKKETLAFKARVGMSSVKRTLQRLVEDGFLEALEESPGRHPSRYRFLFPEVSVVFDSRSPTGPRWTGSSGPNRSTSTRQPVHSYPPTGPPVPEKHAHKERSQEIPKSQPNAVSESTSSLAPGPRTPALAPEAQRLCALLADLIAANGSKRPTVTDTWLIECERLIRLDGRSPSQVEKAIHWSQSDPFWRCNILSMPKLRAGYDKLRLAALRSAPAPAPLNRTDQRVLDAMDWAAGREAG